MLPFERSLSLPWIASRNGSFWRILALLGKAPSPIPQSQKQFITIFRPHVYHRQKHRPNGHGSEGSDLPNYDGIDDCRPAALRGMLAPLKALAKRRGRLGGLGAIKTTAHKLTCLVYRMLKYGEEYVTQSMEEYEAKIKAKMLDTPKRKATAMGFQLSPMPTQ